MAAITVVTISETFTRAGVAIVPTGIPVLSDSSGLYGVKRNDTGQYLVAVNTPMAETVPLSGIWTYSFDEPEGESGIIYTYCIKWVYGGVTHYTEHQIAGTANDDIAVTRQMDKYVDWIKKEFAPLQLIVAQEDDSVIEQQLENAIRYWNTHSAFKTTGIYPYTPGTKRVQIDPAFKGVVDVIPTAAASYIWSSHPLWTLVGITVLDNVTSDLIMMSEAFRSYRIYVGTNFRFAYHKSDIPTAGGYLYCSNVPPGCQSLMVIGTRRITKNEDIKNDYIQDWILYYAKALVKQIEGNVLRKAMIIDTPLDGQTLVDEGREEQKALKEALQKDSRWVIFMRRK
ncbi:MAG: hypothetical protein IMZ47_06625 [Firmicutes bacterium]|nr:hypothetical protein [Bacillota bacterium]